MKKLLILSTITIIAISLYFYNSINQVKATETTKQTTQIETKQQPNKTNVKPTIDHTEQQNKLEVFTYQITKIDESGYYGDSTTDQTGIYFVNENVPKGTTIKEGDTVKVSFPNNSFEIITNIEVVKN
jgi:hypothetical protein